MRRKAPPANTGASARYTGKITWRETRDHYIHVLAFVLLAYVIVWYYTDRVPTPKADLATPLSEFSEERARRFLTPLLDKIGYRISGTPENEIHTANLILQGIEDVRESASCKRKGTCPDIEVNVQHPNGSFVLKFMDFFITNRFTNVTNIVLRLSTPQANANAKANANTGSILINSHFDSALGGLGATDAGAPISVMIEMLRNILNSDQQQFPLNYPLILLFNGAEESLMMASQGFMASHPWAKEVRMVLNMDSTGVGAAALFQQNSDRVLRAYAAAAPYPHATSFAVDLFKTEKFPGDTDYRIFRDYSNGRINGADFAYYRNGYMYHTLIDDDAHLLNGSIQHMGENLLATLRYIMKNKMLDEAETAQINVFFDILGKYMILLPEVQASIAAILVLTVCIPFFFWSFTTRSLSYSTLFTRVLPSFVSVVFSVIFAFMYASVAGALMAYIKPLTWYTHKVIVFPLFFTPAAIGIVVSQMLYHRFAIRKHTAKDATEKLAKALEAVKHESSVGVIFFYAVVIVATWNMGSLYFFLIPAFCISVARWLDITQLLSPTTSKFVYLNLMVIPIIFAIDSAYAILELLIPVMGRSGPLVPGDVVVSLISALCACLTTIPLLPLLHQRPAFRTIIKILGSFFFISLVLSAAFAHPYTKDSPKRIIIHHSIHANPQVYKETHSYFQFAGLDIIPPHKDIFDDIFRYFKKDLFPETYEPTSELDWQDLSPFDILITGHKVKSTKPVYQNGHKIEIPLVEVLREHYDPVNNTRHLHLKITNKGAEWSTMRFAGNLVGWDINEPIPPPHRGFNIIRHVGGIGIDSWDTQLTFLGEEKIKFTVTGTHFKASSLVNQITAFFPAWYTTMNIVTAVGSYTM